MQLKKVLSSMMDPPHPRTNVFLLGLLLGFMALGLSGCELTPSDETMGGAPDAPIGFTDRAPKFLIISSPADSNVYYYKMPGFQEAALDKDPMKPPTKAVANITLINGVTSKCLGTSCPVDADRGLQTPQGIALHKAMVSDRHGEDTWERWWHGDSGTVHVLLYVSDCGAQTIYRYQLSTFQDVDGYTLQAGKQVSVAENVPGGARWITLDGRGNLFFSVEEASEIWMIAAADLRPDAQLPTRPRKLYTAHNSAGALSHPGGIIADNFFLYWTNKELGQVAGSVVAGFERPKKGVFTKLPYPKKLAMHEDRIFGVCQANDNLFFTDENTNLFAVKKTGGAIAVVSTELKTPRGCTWDGDGTIFVADRVGNAIYSLPSNFGALRGVKSLRKVVNVNQPCQVQVLVTGAEWNSALQGHGKPGATTGLVFLLFLSKLLLSLSS